MNPRMHASIYVTVALLATAAPVADAQPQNAATSKQSSTQTSTQTGLLPSFTAQGKNLIRLQVGAFDPLQTQPKVNPKIPLVNDESIPNGHPTYWLVQVKDNRFAEVAKAIRQTGAERVGNVPDAVYMVRATREQRLALASHPAVRWTGLYQPAWRVPAKANGKPGLLDLKGTQNYQVHLFRSHPDPSAVARAIKPPAKVTSTGTVLAVQASAEQVPAIAALDGVEWVTVKPTVVLLNENARWVLDTGERDIFAATRQDRLTGKGQTAAVADTGVNYKPDVNGRAHVAFRDCTPVCEEADYTQETAGTDTDQLTTIVQHNPAGSHRKMAAFFDLGDVGPNPPDESSHGTHVAGSVNGDAGKLGAHDGHDGIAPAARLVMQSIADSGGGLNTPGDYYQLFRQAYRPRSPASVPEEYNPADYANYRANEDARTHNNSYGLIVPIADIGQAIAIDQFVWDHEDMSIVVSAGNSGPDLLSIGAPSVSKNGLSSAASSNGRQPMVSIDALTNFSSHGPTGDGRFGPTVATPGEIVVGPKGGTVDANHYLQGTSMSGPVLTGAVTLVRQYFWDGYGPAGGQGFPSGTPSTARRHNPSAALVKAAVVDGATRMRGYYTGDDGTQRALDGQWPSSGQGFGLVNLDNSLYFSGDPLNNWYHDVYRSDDDAFDIGNGGSRSYQIDVNAGQPLDVTLAWSDAPDLLPAGSPNLVNNLDLVVTGPENQAYVGNNMNTRHDPGAETGATINDANAAPDVVNNIERVSVPNAQAGRYTVTVLAPVIADGPQGFALTAKGAIYQPQTASFKPGPARQANTAGSPTIRGLAVEPVSADLARVTFTTSEPTTAHVTVSGINQQFADVYTLTDAGYHGIETSPVETSPVYSGKRVVGTRHEVLVTGLKPGVSYVPTAHVTDLGGRNASLRGSPFRSPANTFQPGAPDIGQLSSAEFTDLGPASRPVAGDQWEIGKQLYAGNDGSNQLLGAFMFRLPPSVNPAAITGAHIEFSSAHILSSVYTADPVFSVDLLDSSVEPEWGTQIYEEIADAPATARLNPASTMRRGANERIDYAFSCNELGALKATLTEQTGGTRNAAFRYVSTEEDEVSLVSMEFGFNRRSHGAQLRPKLVLETSNPPSVPPFTRCNPATPAPTISDVGIHPGLTPDAMGVSWRTNVNSSSVVLFRQKGASAWTQVASNALTKLHQIEVRGLDSNKHYEFGVRSVACNGATRTADNSGRGWDFFSEPDAPVATHPYDFEASAQGWTTSSQELDGTAPTIGTEWERRSPGHQSQQAWYAMPYGDHSEADLISPQLALPGTVTSVRFYAAYDFEVPIPGATETSDGLYVDYSSDGGASWSNVGVLQGSNASYPEFDLHQVTFSTPPGPVQVRIQLSSDDSISSPPFEGAKVDTVTVLSYSPISSGQQPSAGPYPPPSAGASGLNLAAVRPSGAPTALERASGTGVCVAASSRGRVTPLPPPGPSGPGLPATGGLESTVIGAGLLALLAGAMIRRRRLHHG